MAVNVFKDSTFFKAISTWWDGSETPKQLATKIETKLNSEQKLGGRDIVLESDTGTWYTYLDALDSDERGWYDSDGTKKA